VADCDDEVISLYEVSKRIGLRDRGKRDWTPFLKTLCLRAGIEVRPDDRGVACCRHSDLGRIEVVVDRHFNRPRLWPKKTQVGRI
jgi:hypothetical protein